MNAGQMLLLKELSESDRRAFQTAYHEREKSVSLGVCLALALGVFGAHHFYMNNNKKGLLYLGFSWTLVPAVLSLADAMKIADRIRQHNCVMASELVREMSLAAPQRKLPAPLKVAA